MLCPIKPVSDVGRDLQVRFRIGLGGKRNGFFREANPISGRSPRRMTHPGHSLTTVGLSSRRADSTALRPGLDEVAEAGLGPGNELASLVGPPPPPTRLSWAMWSTIWSRVLPPLRPASLICSQISPSRFPSQAISAGARCHWGWPGRRASSRFSFRGRCRSASRRRPGRLCP